MTLHLDLIRTEDARFIIRIGGLQSDRASLAPEPFQGHFKIIDQGDDNLAIFRRFAFADYHGIAIMDTGINHRITSHFKAVMPTGR